MKRRWRNYPEPVADERPFTIQLSVSAMATTGLAPVQALVGKLASSELRRMVLTGMGSSHHALHPTYLRLITRGLNVQRIETSELLHHVPTLIAPDSLVVAVSQSGRSAEIRQLLARVNGPLVAVTNSAGNPLALKADFVLVTQAGNETTVSCFPPGTSFRVKFSP